MSQNFSFIKNSNKMTRGEAMKRNTILKLAISAAIVAIPTSGCATFTNKITGVSNPADAGVEKAAKWAAKAEKHLASGKVDKSVSYAEKAVEADFNNSAYRATLARGYIAQGRFLSAERTLQDVLDLGQNDPRTVVSLALLRTSQGKTASAISMLDSYRDILPVGDYGLALAVAGDNQRAVNTLEDGVRNANSSQMRQNLALAYALNGQWREARVMAGQDLNGTQVNQNIQKWVLYARPDAYQERVVGLLGVRPAADNGQPVRLALNSRNNIDLASLQPAQSDLPNNAAFNGGELPAIGPAPTSKNIAAPKSLVDNLFAAKEDNVEIKPSIKSVDLPASRASVNKSEEAAADRFIFEKPASNAASKPVKSNPPAKLAVADTKSVPTLRTADGGTYMVQLGAFSSVQNANQAWDKFTAKYNVLKPFESGSLAVKANGKTLYRLSAMGFGNKESASTVCDSIKAKGGSCIVRKDNGKTPVRLASK